MGTREAAGVHNPEEGVLHIQGEGEVLHRVLEVGNVPEAGVRTVLHEVAGVHVADT